MDTKEILWDSNRPKFGEGKIFGEDAVAPLGSLEGIEEDLQRAITALRAVPTFSWSVNSLLEAQGQGQGQGQAVTSAEYVWKAEDFDWPYKDRPLLHDRNFAHCIDAETKDRIGQMPSDFGLSEIRTDTFTALSKQIHLAPDRSCRISDENSEASFRVCLSGQKKKLAEISSSSADSKMSKPPPHRPPLSYSLRSNSDVPRRAAPPVLPKPPPASNPRRLLRGQVDGAKADKINRVQRPETEEEEDDTSDAVRGIFDFYERSLDILESEELKKRRKKSEVSSPRSNSPEAMLEELLDSISADEYDTLPSESTKNKDIAKRALPSSAKTQEIRGHIYSPSSSSSSSSSSAERWRPCETKTFMVTGFQNLVFETSDPANVSAREQNNNDVACHDQAIEHPTGHSSTKQSQDAAVSSNSIAARAQLPTTSAVYQTRRSDQAVDETELTPEDIFEEIMDSMETCGGKRKENAGTARGYLDATGKNRQALPNNMRDAKTVHSESVFGFSRDYCADNGLLSVFYNRSRSGMQLCLREKIRKSRSEDIAAAAAAAATAAKTPAHDNKSAPLSTDIHPDSGKPSSTTTPSPVSSSSLSSSASSSARPPPPLHPPPPPPETRPTSQRAQEAIYCTVKQKPAPPLRQKATGPTLPSLSLSLSRFDAEQHTLVYNVRQPPVSRQQPPPPPPPRPPPPPSKVGCSRRGETADFEAECRHTSVEIRSSSPDQGPGVLEPLPKDPAKVSSPTDEEEEEEEAKKASSTGVREAKYLPLLLPDEKEKRNGTSSKREKILFSSGFADDKKRNDGGEGEGEEIEKNYGGEGEGIGEGEGEEIDLDLDAEFCRNLDACTGSDVECSGIDKLMSAESQNERSIIAEDKCTKQKPKSPRKLGILIAKRRLRKAPHAVDGYEEAPTTTTSLDLSQPPSYHQESKTDPTRTPSQPTDPLETVPVSDQVVASTQGTDGRYGNFYSASKDVSDPELGKDAMRRRCETRVLSEEVTSQELLLKIVWPKKDITGLALGKMPQRTVKPPFRELQLHRMLRICDDDDENYPDPDPPRISQTNATHDVPALSGMIEYRHDSPVPEEYATKEPEDRSGVNYRRVERHVSGTPISVNQRDTVRVVRAPLANGHAVKNIKEVVEGVGYTIIQDFERSPVKRNIKVSCEATECKSESAIRDHQDVTIIRNTILDTLRPNTTPAFALSRQGSSAAEETLDL